MAKGVQATQAIRLAHEHQTLMQRLAARQRQQVQLRAGDVLLFLHECPKSGSRAAVAGACPGRISYDSAYARHDSHVVVLCFRNPFAIPR